MPFNNKLTNGLLYSHKGKALISPSVVETSKTYRPCDLVLFMSRYDDLSTKHNKLCKEKVETYNHDPSLIAAETDNYIALEGRYTYELAIRACQEYEMDIATVTDQTSYDELRLPMVKANISHAFSGLIYSLPQNEFIFQDTRRMAANIVLKKIWDRTNGGYVTWDVLRQKINRPSYYNFGCYTEYKLEDDGLDIIATMESDNGSKFAKVGYARQLAAICSKRSNTQTELNEENWRQRCKSEQLLLEQDREEMVRIIQEISPSIYNDDQPKLLPSNIEYPNINNDDKNSDFKQIFKNNTTTLYHK